MIKKHQKWIALTVVFAFLCLLQISAMPLRAARAPARSETTVSGADQGPDFFQKEGAPSGAKKKSIVPVLLIGLGVAAVAAVLVLAVFKTKYDPVGNWTGEFASQTQNWKASVVFTGDKESGTVSYNEPPYSPQNGTYTVSDKEITWNFTWDTGQTITHIGKFDGKNTMSGTWKNENYSDMFGTWTLIRGVDAANNPTPMNLANLQANLGALDCRLIRKDRAALDKLADRVLGNRYSPDDMGRVTQ